MLRIELNTDEQMLLQQVLERRIRDLEIEILHTDHAEFRNLLKEHLALLRRLVSRLTTPVALAA